MAIAVGTHHRPVGAFNPAWCLWPPSTGERDAVRRWEDGPLSSMSTSSSTKTRRTHAHRGSASEPLSPRVGCMGQIKRDKAAGEGGGSLSVRATLLKLGKFFSGRNALPSAAVAVSAPGSRTKAGAGCGGAPRACMVELDPPLPVVKAAAGKARPVSLWRRRCGEEVVLEGLQLRPERQLPAPCVY